MTPSFDFVALVVGKKWAFYWAFFSTRVKV